MILYIDIFSFCLTFDIFYKNNTGFVISIKHIGIYKVYNPQLVKKLPNPHTFVGHICYNNIFGFNNEGKNGTLLFAIPKD